MTLTVSRLYVYPIKSCGGIALPYVNHSLRGFLHDREWAVVDEKSGDVLTQREEPRLCLVATAIADDALAFSAPESGELRIPIKDDESPALGRRIVRIWDACAPAVDQGMWPAGWFSTFLKRRCRLVRMSRGHRRPSAALPTSNMGFADAHEILVISEASLAGLNARLAVPVPMERFRPNIVVAGCEPHAEDDWTAILAASVRFVGANRCIRCVITTTDQRTAARGKEPLATLASYRKAPKGVVFGRYFNAINGGCIRVGDVVEPLSAPW